MMVQEWLDLKAEKNQGVLGTADGCGVNVSSRENSCCSAACTDAAVAEEFRVTNCPHSGDVSDGASYVDSLKCYDAEEACLTGHWHGCSLSSPLFSSSPSFYLSLPQDRVLLNSLGCL